MRYIFILLLIAGCASKPVKLQSVDLNNDGITDVYTSVDKSKLQKNEVSIDAKNFVVTDTYDNLFSTILYDIGKIFGIPILIVIGSLWGRRRYIRIIYELIYSIQQARKYIKNSSGTTDVIDRQLSKNQNDFTKDYIKKFKERNNIKSVN